MDMKPFSLPAHSTFSAKMMQCSAAPELNNEQQVKSPTLPYLRSLQISFSSVDAASQSVQLPPFPIDGPAYRDLPKELVEIERLLQFEIKQVERLKLYFASAQCISADEKVSSTLQHQLNDVGAEIVSIWDKRRDLLSSLVSLPSPAKTSKESNGTPAVLPTQSNSVSSPVESLSSEEEAESLLSIATQPAEVAVANRYLVPSPVVCLSPSFERRPDQGKLIISVRLLYHASDKEVKKTIYGEKDILQGIKQQTIDATGQVVFSKLKVMEVSSKHKHQAFCLEFSLDEYTSQGRKQCVAIIKSTPFHVHSRSSNKRKREGEDVDEKDGSSVTSTTTSPAKEENTTPRRSSRPSKRSRTGSLSEVLLDPMTSSSIGESSGPDTQRLRRSAPVPDFTQVDITSLLTLPQKDAARKLGISESMLCKRFKECTRRKWPYRYLRKIDKVINMIKLHRANGVLPEEDNDKLQRLIKERKECLKPVHIRITSYDRLSTSSASSSPPPTESPTLGNDDDLDEDIPLDALETLEMLRMGYGSPNPKEDLLSGGVTDQLAPRKQNKLEANVLHSPDPSSSPCDP